MLPRDSQRTNSRSSLKWLIDALPPSPSGTIFLVSRLTTDWLLLQCRGPSIAPVEWCLWPATMPVRSLGLAQIETAASSGSMRSSAGCRYSSGISGWRIPAQSLKRGHYYCNREILATQYIQQPKKRVPQPQGYMVLFFKLKLALYCCPSSTM